LGREGNSISGRYCVHYFAGRGLAGRGDKGFGDSIVGEGGEVSSCCLESVFYAQKRGGGGKEKGDVIYSEKRTDSIARFKGRRKGCHGLQGRIRRSAIPCINGKKGKHLLMLKKISDQRRREGHYAYRRGRRPLCQGKGEKEDS